MKLRIFYSESEEMSLAKAYRKFLDSSLQAKSAARSAEAAEQFQVSLVKQLYHYFKANDIDCEVLLGVGYRGKLVSPSKELAELIQEMGLTKVAKSIEHAVVKVNQLVIDPSYRRLGTEYEERDNYPVRDFYKYWMAVRPLKHLLELSPTAVMQRIEILREQENNPHRHKESPNAGGTSYASDEIPSNVEYWLLKMAAYLKGNNVFGRPRVCHKTTAFGINKHPQLDNKIWIFGKPLYGNSGKKGIGIIHSLLTDKDNNVLANEYPGVPNGHFDAKRGYFVPTLNSGKGQYISSAYIMTIDEFFKQYLGDK